MILVGMGCSHTQGCAIIKGAHRTKIKLPLASEELKKWYKKDFVSEEWITENYSWIGMLGKLLKADDLINFGFVITFRLVQDFKSFSASLSSINLSLKTYPVPVRFCKSISKGR